MKNAPPNLTMLLVRAVFALAAAVCLQSGYARDAFSQSGPDKGAPGKLEHLAPLAESDFREGDIIFQRYRSGHTLQCTHPLSV